MILSPMATGNGAFILHKIIEAGLSDYKVIPYHPLWTLTPPFLPLFCRANHPTLIHTSPDYGWFFQKRGAPLVLTFHNYVLDPFMRAYSTRVQSLHYRTTLRWFTRMALTSAALVTSVSQFTARLVAQELRYKKGIRVIYNGIDTTRFVPSRKVEERGPIRVLFSGNLIIRKGMHFLPEIARLLNPGIEIVVTRGMRKSSLLPPSPRFKDVGSVPYEAMPTLYQQSHILLFPTVREGFGLAAVEAMACGLPVVATNCSSLPELIVEGRGGFLCDLGDSRMFAERINALADSPSLRQEMGTFNRQRAEELFSMERMLSEYRDLFAKVTNRR